MKLTDNELKFLSTQGMSADDVFNCAGPVSTNCKKLARAKGKRVLIGTPCNKAGHRLRTRSNHCFQCDTSKMGFQKRHRRAGYVYIAVSEKVRFIKIGSSIETDNREKKLNFDGYGGADDWRLIFSVKVKEMGRLEQEVHTLLNRYSAGSTYKKDGKTQVARECFKYPPLNAVKLISDVIRTKKHQYSDLWRDKDFRW